LCLPSPQEQLGDTTTKAWGTASLKRSLYDLDSGSTFPDVGRMVVESPKTRATSTNTIRNWAAFRLDRVLYSPVHYPGD